jgi:hypothetical protein
MHRAVRTKSSPGPRGASCVLRRRTIPPSLRSKILLANRHTCCICGRSDVVIHHINGNPSDNSEKNLAVVCQDHHDKATAPAGLTARLRPSEIVAYKRSWEQACRDRAHTLARSRTAFFMVDYKNAERIRQLYSQLSATERHRAYDLLQAQFREEDDLRRQQGFDASIEPTTAWNPVTEQLLAELKTGSVHPGFFKGWKGHPLDPLFPIGFSGSIATFAYYDVWCQIMIRAILISRSTYDLDDLIALEDPSKAHLEGQLVSFHGPLRGDVALPEEWRQKSISKTLLVVRHGHQTWRSVLELKTHYVYSMTASSALSKGTENGVLLFRSVEPIRSNPRGRRVLTFSSTPLIIGSGALEIPSSPVV